MESISKTPFAFWLVAEALVVTAQAEDVPDAQGRRAEHVGLQGDPVPVPRHHLEHRVEALLP